jgi:arginyl-tRNA--protein-N-Asp/Glu arginylyltransferase
VVVSGAGFPDYPVVTIGGRPAAVVGHSLTGLTVSTPGGSPGTNADVTVADRGSQSLSAVYCAFAPHFSDVSLGTYCILKQIEACRAWGLRYLYLGLYVADCRHLAYKARFLPHERLVRGEWRRFDRPAAAPSTP